LQTVPTSNPHHDHRRYHHHHYKNNLSNCLTKKQTATQTRLEEDETEQQNLGSDTGLKQKLISIKSYNKDMADYSAAVFFNYLQQTWN